MRTSIIRPLSGIDTQTIKQFTKFLARLKKGILFGGTSTRAPVFGLRPMPPRLCRVWKLPNPRISTLSPDRRAWTMLSNMAQTAWASVKVSRLPAGRTQELRTERQDWNQ
jgi:hypothetical protein